MDHLTSGILPVLQAMPDVPVKAPLLNAFSTVKNDFAAIEQAFRSLTSREQEPAFLRRFFASWSQTNNSAMTTSGLSNRLTLLLHRGEPVRDRLELLNTLVSLHRITDEDLAVTHRILHSQMFHEMATGIIGDDAWLQTQYIDPVAIDFKKWKDQMALRESDLAVGLITTLVHEIYTHGEVEFILPLFTRWLNDEYHFSEAEANRTLRWIKVHCGGTEKNHFDHAVAALAHYANAFGLDWSQYDVEGIVRTYTQKKAAVLVAVVPSGHA